VLHRWWVPGLTAKADVLPGQSNTTWFKADEEGSWEGASYAFSGASYATMRIKVTALSVPDYEAWLSQQADDIQAAQEFVQEQIAAGDEVGGVAGE